MRITLTLMSFLVGLGIALTAGTPAALAQSYSQSFEAISRLNQSDPEQNPSYESTADILDRHVLDGKNKVIGEVQDVVLRSNGTIEMLDVDLDRLRLGKLALNYQSMGISPVSNAYAVNLDGDQIESLYPTLLADIETAAGREDIFSVSALIGGQLKTESGRQLGIIEDVLFNTNGQRAVALLVKPSRGDKIAVPFNNPTLEDSSNNRKNVIITEDMANAFTDYAKAN